MINKEKIAATRRAYRLANREAIAIKKAAYDKGYSRANRGKRNATTAAWAAEHPERVKQYSLAYAEANKEKLNAKSIAWNAENGERRRENGAKWRAANRELTATHSRNYKAKKSANGGTHTVDDIFRLMALQGGKCIGCYKSIAETSYHVDHIHPVSRGGRNDPTNLQLLCPRCNLSKGAKLPTEWANVRGLLL